jgi:hypothetical protein
VVLETLSTYDVAGRDGQLIELRLGGDAPKPLPLLVTVVTARGTLTAPSG